MASIRVRPRKGTSPQVTVLWRDPDTAKQCSMPFEDAQSAERFRRLLTANANHLGRVTIEELTAAKVKAWLKVMAATDCSDKSLHNWHGLLSAAVSTAVQAGHRSDNPCRGIRLPRRNEHSAVEMTVLTQAEWTTLDAELGKVRGGNYQLFFRTLLGTGMRWGEATALQVSDLSLDIDPPSLRISRATRRDENSASYVGPTKTRRSRRTISLHADLAAQLREHVKGKRGNELVFTGESGQVLHASNVRNRAWTPAVAAAMDPAHGAAMLAQAPRIHDLRHTHASWLLAAGVDLLTVQRRLGHESITTTADRYGHAMPAQQRAAAQAIAAALGF
jgi:integrase